MSDIYERFPDADILERLADLPNQPSSTHYQSYVRCIAHEAAEEIKRLRFQIGALEQLLSAYRTAQRPGYRLTGHVRDIPPDK